MRLMLAVPCQPAKCSHGVIFNESQESARGMVSPVNQQRLIEYPVRPLAGNRQNPYSLLLVEPVMDNRRLAIFRPVRQEPEELRNAGEVRHEAGRDRDPVATPLAAYVIAELKEEPPAPAIW